MEFKLSQALTLQKKYGLNIRVILKWEKEKRIPNEYAQGETHHGTYYNLEEKEFLIKNYEHLPKEELITHLRRTWGAITEKARKMGLKREREKPNPNAWLSEWDDNQIQYVKEWICHLSASEIKSATGKTFGQISNLRNYLLERNEILGPLFLCPKIPWSETEKLYLKESFRSKSMEVMCLTLRRHATDIYKKAKELKLKRASKWAIQKEGLMLKSVTDNLTIA